MKHGKSGTPEYRAWYNLLQHKDVCDAWLLFENFLVDVGPRPSNKHHLRFVPTEQDKRKLAEYYYVKRGPENCKWVEEE